MSAPFTDFSDARGHLEIEPPAEDVVLDLFAGPGGWDVGAWILGICNMLGIELEGSACMTRVAAGFATIRADITRVPAAVFAGKVTGLVGSPPCTTFSAAGSGAGNAIKHLLTELIRDLMAGRDTRRTHQRLMIRALRLAGWPPARVRNTRRFGTGAGSQRGPFGKTPVRLTRAEQTAVIRAAVASAALVAEPARFIAACRPEWICLEQVPSVLPLWQVYAAELRKLGYSVWAGKINAADYGIPQTRERAILIASRVRQVTCPTPTHYDPRRGFSLGGEEWVSMARALGWGMTGRPYYALATAGGKRGGADEQVGGSAARQGLYAEQIAGRWVTVRPEHIELQLDNQEHATIRRATEPAMGIKTGHSAAEMLWRLHTNRDQRADGSRQQVDPAAGPAPTLTGKSGGQWVMEGPAGAGGPGGDPAVMLNMRQDYDKGGRRVDPAAQPSPTVTSMVPRQWVVEGAVSSSQPNATVRGPAEPAATILYGGKGNPGADWRLWTVEGFVNNNNANACKRDPDEPAGTIFYGARLNSGADWKLTRERGAGMVERHGERPDRAPGDPAPTITSGSKGSGTRLAWTRDRPATTVAGDPRVGRPGHKDREGGERQFEKDLVRITVQEAAILQGFPWWYPWQGVATHQYQQVGNAWCPGAAAAVIGAATGIAWEDRVAAFYSTGPGAPARPLAPAVLGPADPDEAAGDGLPQDGEGADAA